MTETTLKPASSVSFLTKFSARHLGVRSIVMHQWEEGGDWQKSVLFGQPHGPLSSGEKLVYFVRHGRSVANAAENQDDNLLPAATDSPLHEVGLKQASNLPTISKDWNLQIAFTSPMRRAALTAALGLKGIQVPIVTWPVLTEFYPLAFENHAFKLSENAVFFEGLPSKVHTDGLADEWWSPLLAGDETRVADFLNWLSICPENRIAVFTHWGFIRRVMQALNFHDSFSPDNCSPIEITFKPPRLLPDYPYYSIRVVPSSQPDNPLVSQLWNFYEDCQTHTELMNATELGPLRLTMTDFWPLGPEDVSNLKSHLAEAAKLIRKSSAPIFTNVETKVDRGKALFIHLDVESPVLESLRDTLASEDCHIFEGCRYAVRRSFHVSVLRDDKPAGKSFDLPDFMEVIQKYPLVNQLIQSAGSPAIKLSSSVEDEEDWRYWFHKIRWTLLLSSRSGEKMKWLLHEGAKK